MEKLLRPEVRASALHDLTARRLAGKLLGALALTVSLAGLPRHAACATRGGTQPSAASAQTSPSPPSTSPHSPASKADKEIPACRSETYPFLEERRPLQQEALVQARRWLDALRVDPFELRTVGIKGKKKLVELLDTYARLWQIADAMDKAALLERFRRAAAVTSDPRYHDMGRVDDKTFNQDSTSYLRAAFLMDRLGLDTKAYRREIAAIKPRLDAQMSQRGVHQRLAFHMYYQHFGLAEPFDLGGAAQGGLIAKRADPDLIQEPQEYDFTHEIFVPYEFGDKLDVEPFGAADLDYIRNALRVLIPRNIARRNSDLLGEMVTCARLVRFVEDPVYRNGLEFLLYHENPDGSWGNASLARRIYGEYAAQGDLLHTTEVVIDALALSFHDPWNRGLYPGCAPLAIPIDKK